LGIWVPNQKARYFFGSNFWPLLKSATCFWTHPYKSLSIPFTRTAQRKAALLTYPVAESPVGIEQELPATCRPAAAAPRARRLPLCGHERDLALLGRLFGPSRPASTAAASAAHRRPRHVGFVPEMCIRACFESKYEHKWKYLRKK